MYICGKYGLLYMSEENEDLREFCPDPLRMLLLFSLGDNSVTLPATA